MANLRDAFRTQLWPIPAIAVVAALLGLGLPFDPVETAGLESLGDRVEAELHRAGPGPGLINGR